MQLDEDRQMTIRFDPAQFRAARAQTDDGSDRLEAPLVELVKIRSAQLHGSAACAAIYVGAARSLGESEERIEALHRWRESLLFSGRERAALAWVEAMTGRLDEGRLREAGQALALWFTPGERVRLALLVLVMDRFNQAGVQAAGA